MAAINSQLDVAYNLSSLCRQVLSATQGDSREEADPTKDREKPHNSLDSSLTAHGGARKNRDLSDALNGTGRRRDRNHSVGANQGHLREDSFLTEVPSADMRYSSALQPPRRADGAPHAEQGNGLPLVIDANGPEDGPTHRRAEMGMPGGVQAVGMRLSREVSSSGGIGGDEGGRTVADEAAQGQVQAPRSGMRHGGIKKDTASFEGSPSRRDARDTTRGNVKALEGIISDGEHKRERSFTGRDTRREDTGRPGTPVTFERVALSEQTSQRGGQPSENVPGRKTTSPSVGMTGHRPDAGPVGITRLSPALPLDDSQQLQPGESEGQGSDDEYLEDDDDNEEEGGGDWSSWLK